MNDSEGTARGLQLRGIAKWYGDVPAVRTLDLDVAAGEFVVLLGPSGCGKTTVLRTIAGLEEPSAGEVRIGDRVVNNIEPADRDVAMVFQNYALYPHMTVRQNLGFGLKMRRTPKAEIHEKVERAASILGLEPLLKRRPGQLSGGQRQRVALGRALVREPSIFLFDEPLSNLDARLRLEMRSEIAQLHQRLGTTMVFVTHDQVEAMTLGERIAILKDGVLEQHAAPLDIYRMPANLFVATFIGSPPINTLEGEVSTDGDQSVFSGPGLTCHMDRHSYSGPATLAVRAESLSLNTGSGHDFTSAVLRTEPLGNEVLVHLNGPGERSWIARLDPENPCAVGDSIRVSINRARTHLFAGPTQKRLQRKTEEAIA
jgi:sn-glycerol 3-phosphate transport system ATP-binding protein